MRRVLLLLLTLLGTGPVAAQEPVPSTTHTPTPTHTPAPTGTATPSPTPAPTHTATPTHTAAPTHTATPVPTFTATPTPVPTGTSLPGEVDGYEPDDRPQQARRLVAGEVQLRTFYRPEGKDVDWVIVYLKRGRWRLAAETTTGIYDPRLTLDGGLVGDDSGASKDAILELTVEADGEHLLKVENLGLDGPGSYHLGLERVGDFPTPTPTSTPVPDPGTEDGFEPDGPPHAPGYAGPQLRSFNPVGDEDFVRYRLKAGLRIWVETSELTGGADTELHIFHDEDGILTGEDPWLAGDDDGGPGLGSRATVRVEADRWLTILIRNRAAAWGPATGYTLRILTDAEATPTASVPPAPTLRPTYTPYPTHTPLPSPTASATESPPPVYTPLPTATRSPAASGPVTGAAREVPPLPTPAAGPARLRLHVFLDMNRNGLMDFGEESENVLVFATTRDRQWEAEAYTSQGEAVLSLDGLPVGKELLLFVPYLHRSALFQPKEGEMQEELPLDLPAYPLYLP